MKTLKITTILVLIALLCSCNENTQETTPNMLIDTAKLVKGDTKKDTLIDSDNFQTFWLGFRKIVLSKDSNRINEVINIPFEISGFEDRDPRLMLIDKDSINTFFYKFLFESNVSYPSISNHLELINNVTQLEAFSGYTASENWRRIEQMEFRNERNRWRLTKIYLDTKGLNKTH